MGLFDIFKKKSAETTPQSIAPNQPAIQFVSLFYENKPEINTDAILAELKQRFANVEPLQIDGTTAFAFPDFMTDFNGVNVPAQGLILNTDVEIDLDKYKEAIADSIQWSGAEDAMKKCRYQVSVTELLSKGLPHQARLEFFNTLVCAVVQATGAQVVYYRNSNKLLDATKFMEACDAQEPEFLEGAMNFRLFELSNGEILMDTLGLHAYGIADFQCSFRKYEAHEIAGMLNMLAYYVVDTGDFIRDNTTVQGIGKNPVWKTRYEASKVEPTRQVVTVIPNY
ncbi:DUF4261 domain-containing protein [Emticicia sp. 21SJ11W-3]|uniref:DUF4261 domain-containing protein n=1 Tax=Emticicia sp. 21SJ11W-3 TaxID=2916755 RepID=UPI00209E3422|nr:DUF4261 domain-containing protein [Emticicia sp. 21SJ11W-3]UTA66729.1 DUF4261 domain-containing protein [Emticicia sp. 21SJ11W-3]